MRTSSNFQDSTCVNLRYRNRFPLPTATSTNQSAIQKNHELAHPCTQTLYTGATSKGTKYALEMPVKNRSHLRAPEHHVPFYHAGLNRSGTRDIAPNAIGRNQPRRCLVNRWFLVCFKGRAKNVLLPRCSAVARSFLLSLQRFQQRRHPQPANLSRRKPSDHQEPRLP